MVAIHTEGSAARRLVRVARRPPTAIGITSAIAWSIGTQFARRFW